MSNKNKYSNAFVKVDSLKSVDIEKALASDMAGTCIALRKSPPCVMRSMSGTV